MSPDPPPATIEARLQQPRVTGLPRPRLVGPLLEPGGAGVVVVVAPAGSGKTTLLAMAAAEAPQPVAWYTADADDRSGPGFLAHVARAVADTCGCAVPEPTSAAELLAELAEPTTGPGLVLVIDDAHELAGGPAEHVLDALLRWRPPHVRILLGTRRQPSASTSRLLLSGDLLELDAEALRFRSWEVEELFRAVYAAPLSPEGAAALTRRTGGWAAGLVLFRLAVSGKSEHERERAVAELGGRSRLVRSYLTRTVLDELDPQHREFLLATCTLDPLTGPLCDALLEREGSSVVLQDLADRQFFITPAPDGLTYRYHPVLRTLLEGLLLEELGPHASAEMHARAARLMESAGRLREAMRGYAIAEDFASVARLLQRSRDEITVADDALSDALPTDDPWLALVQARRRLRSGSVAAAVAEYRRAASLLDDADFRMRCAEERASATLWAGDAQLGRVPATPAEAVRRCTRAVDHEPLDHPLAHGVALLLAGEPDRARTRLDEVTPDRPVERLLADLVDQAAKVAAGTPEGLVGRLEEIALTADVDEQPWVARLARGLQGCALLVTHPAPWRLGSCAAQVELCHRDDDHWGALLLAGALGTALALRGQTGDSDSWFDEAEQIAEALGAPVLGAWARVLRDGRPTARDRALGLVGAAAVAARLRSSVHRGTPAEPEAPVPAQAGPGQARRGLRVTCLGGFAVLRAGVEVDLPELRPRPRELLVLLAAQHGRDVHREVLIEALWRDAPPEAAVHRLHAAASSVRRCLAGAGLGDSLVRHGEAYCLRLPGAVLDVDELDRALHEGARCRALEDPAGALRAWQRALDLYRGDLLSELGPAEWVVPERERLRVTTARAATGAAEAALELDRADLALVAAQRAVELDPLRDSAWSLLAEVQERLGDRHAAAATRQEYAVVTAELDLP